MEVTEVLIHAGGRGKAGGVKVAKSKEDVIEFANNIIGTRLVTYQTDANGQPVNSIIVAEDVYPVERQLYLGAVVDRSSRRITFMASTEGGVEIEKVAEETPEKIIKVEVDPLVGLQPFQAREVAFALALKDKQIGQFVKIMTAAYDAFVENDFALFEINPLSVRENGEILCVDAKVGIDSNALYRLPEVAALRDKSQENERELKASEFDLNYVALEGNIGCMVNGGDVGGVFEIVKRNNRHISFLVPAETPEGPSDPSARGARKHPRIGAVPDDPGPCAIAACRRRSRKADSTVPGKRSGSQIPDVKDSHRRAAACVFGSTYFTLLRLSTPTFQTTAPTAYTSPKRPLLTRLC